MQGPTDGNHVSFPPIPSRYDNDIDGSEGSSAEACIESVPDLVDSYSACGTDRTSHHSREDEDDQSISGSSSSSHTGSSFSSVQLDTFIIDENKADITEGDQNEFGRQQSGIDKVDSKEEEENGDESDDMKKRRIGKKWKAALTTTAVVASAALRGAVANDVVDEEDVAVGVVYLHGTGGGGGGGAGGGAAGTGAVTSGGGASGGGGAGGGAAQTQALQQMAVAASQNAASAVAAGAGAAGAAAASTAMAVGATVAVAAVAAAVAAGVIVSKNQKSSESLPAACPGVTEFETNPGRIDIDFLGLDEPLDEAESIQLASIFEEAYHTVMGDCSGEFSRSLVNTKIECDGDAKRCCTEETTPQFGDVIRCSFVSKVQCSGCNPREPYFTPIDQRMLALQAADHRDVVGNYGNGINNDEATAEWSRFLQNGSELAVIEQLAIGCTDTTICDGSRDPSQQIASFRLKDVEGNDATDLIPVLESTPTESPTHLPTRKTDPPVGEPTFIPTEPISTVPSYMPTKLPSSLPTVDPSFLPSHDTSASPSVGLFFSPTVGPSFTPSHDISSSPSLELSSSPTAEPSPTLSCPAFEACRDGRSLICATDRNGRKFSLCVCNDDNSADYCGNFASDFKEKYCGRCEDHKNDGYFECAEAEFETRKDPGQVFNPFFCQQSEPDDAVRVCLDNGILNGGGEIIGLRGRPRWLPSSGIIPTNQAVDGNLLYCGRCQNIADRDCPTVSGVV